MKNINTGFTLIELMIVVAIIGILAAIAVPAYNDYIARSQVSEAMTLSSGVKTPLAEWVAERGSIPASIASLNATTAGKYVSNVSVGGANPTNPVITVTFKSSGVSPVIRAATLTLSSSNSGASWVCSSSLEDKFLPASCR